MPPPRPNRRAAPLAAVYSGRVSRPPDAEPDLPVPQPVTEQQLRQVLRSCRSIAVVGLSADWHRPSHFAAQYLQQHGYRVLPVNPRYAGQQLLGMPCVARLEDLAEPVDMVDVFRKTEDVGPIADAAIALGARCLWQQLGVRNLAADARARAAGLVSVMDRCVKIEHARLFGGLHWAGINTGVVSARRREG